MSELQELKDALSEHKYELNSILENDDNFARDEGAYFPKKYSEMKIEALNHVIDSLEIKIANLTSIIITSDIEQGSDEWLDMRMGVITASRFSDVLAGGAGKTRLAYMYQLAAETLTRERQDFFTSPAMEWGTKTEPAAREMYEMVSGNLVEQVSFIKFSGKNIGCSPDGLINDDGLIEIKCPKTSTQIETVLSGKMPKIHTAQVQGQLWVSGREWCDFVSFDPRIENENSFFCQRIYRDEKYIADLDSACLKFCDELEAILKIVGG
jgi:putative phage-type endonuclease